MQLEKLQFNGIDNKLTVMLQRQEELYSKILCLESEINKLRNEYRNLNDECHQRFSNIQSDIQQQIIDLKNNADKKMMPESYYTYDELKDIVTSIVADQLNNPSGTLHDLIYYMVRGILQDAFQHY